MKRIVVLNSGAGIVGHTPLLEEFGRKDLKHYHTAELYNHVFEKYMSHKGKKEVIKLLILCKSRRKYRTG